MYLVLSFTCLFEKENVSFFDLSWTLMLARVCSLGLTGSFVGLLPFDLRGLELSFCGQQCVLTW